MKKSKKDKKIAVSKVLDLIEVHRAVRLKKATVGVPALKMAMQAMGAREAVLLIAKALGAGWTVVREVYECVLMVCLSGTLLRERLLDLLNYAVLKAGTDRPKMDYRGEVLLGVEVLPDDAYPDQPVLVTTHQRRYRLSIEEAKARGLRKHPLLMDKAQRRKLKILLLVARWAESVGIYETGMTVRRDGSLEVGLKPSSLAGNKDAKASELFQDRHDKTADITRERWKYMLERERTGRVADSHGYPLLETIARGDNGAIRYVTADRVNLSWQRWVTTTFSPNDSADRWTEPEDRTKGVQPLPRHSREDNKLWKRPRYRLGWDIAAYVREGNTFTHMSVDKVVQTRNGPWTPTDADGNPEQDYYGDVRYTKSWWDKTADRTVDGQSEPVKGRRVTVKGWRKTAFFRHDLEFVVPVDSGAFLFYDKKTGLRSFENLDGERVPCYTIKGSKIGAEQALALLARKNVIIRRDSRVVSEVEGMFRAAIEQKLYSALELVEKSTGFGSEEVLEASCHRCERWFGDDRKKVWNRTPNAHLCPVCGSEAWRVMARVWVERDLFPFLRMPKACTHLSVDVFGPWVRERLKMGNRPGVTYIRNFVKA